LANCLSCKVKINDNAKKCHACQSWQNWKRYFDSSNLVLGAFLLLITFLGVIFQPLMEFMQDESPKIEAAILSSSPQTIDVMISNVGGSVAGIVDMYMNVGDKDGFNVPAGKDSWGNLVKPMETLSFRLESDYYAIPTVANRNHKSFDSIDKGECKFVINFKSFTEDRVINHEKKLSCYNISPTLQAIEDLRFN